MEQQSDFKDHFSGQATEYTRYRPTYPAPLFGWLAGLTQNHERAWDCGCGNGQAAMGLTPYFQEVIATDPSRQQIENAVHHERISYAVVPAEASGLEPASIDLVVIAQALHWFDFERFYGEVRRVVRPAGVLAAISYGEVRVEGAPAPVISRFYHELIGPYWPPERRYVDEHYRTIPFPFDEISAPPFAMEIAWNMEQLLGYLGTWSAVKEYQRHQGAHPLEMIAAELAKAWGDPAELRLVSWPLALRVGLVGSRDDRG
jgi:SAM-dependent methyltransferase